MPSKHQEAGPRPLQVQNHQSSFNQHITASKSQLNHTKANTCLSHSFMYRENRVPYYQRLFQSHDGKRQWWQVRSILSSIHLLESTRSADPTTRQPRQDGSIEGMTKMECRWTAADDFVFWMNRPPAPSTSCTRTTAFSTVVSPVCAPSLCSIPQTNTDLSLHLHDVPCRARLQDLLRKGVRGLYKVELNDSAVVD